MLLEVPDNVRYRRQNRNKLTCIAASFSRQNPEAYIMKRVSAGLMCSRS
jgi:hypothetical protein